MKINCLFLTLLTFSTHIFGQKKDFNNQTQTGVEGIDNSDFSLQSQLTRLDKNGFGFMAPDSLNELINCPQMELWATQYYIHEVKYSKTGIELKDLNEKAIGVKIELCDWCEAAVEGTIYTTDSIGNPLTLNYGGKSKTEQVDCSKCKKYSNYKNTGIRYALWYKAKGKFGDGVNGFKLIPYRTIAVDKTKIPIGTVIFIPNAVGIEILLPDGSKSFHDGYFFAADVGGDIKLNHIDVFTGLPKSKGFGFVQSDSKKTFAAYKVKNKFIEETLIKMHK
jgi:3D (Asp-Asp-Asp) domain-containing protein